LWFSDRSRRLVAEALDQNATAFAVGDEAGALRTRRLFGALSRLAARAAVMPPERGILGAPGIAAPRTSLRLFANVTARALPVAAAVRTLLAVAMSGACLAVARGAITPGAIVRRART